MSHYSPNAEQATVLQQLDRWHSRSDERLFVLHGYAGTGKTATVKHWCETRGFGYLPVAPTAKAAALWEHGTTLHKLVYGEVHDPLADKLHEAARTTDPEQRRARLAEVEALRRGHDLEFHPSGVRAGLVILDEAMMSSQQQAVDILQTGAKVIALGDPFQLPPVKGPPTFTVPDALLTTVMRQGEGSSVALLAEQVRTTDVANPVQLHRLLMRVHDPAAAAAADIVLGATKKGCHGYSARWVYGDMGRLPELGDPVVVVNNGQGLYNGQRFTVLRCKRTRDNTEWWLEAAVTEPNAQGHVQHFRGLVDARPFADPNEANLGHRGGRPMFTWGYAVTVHKAQGSEWNHVHLLPDWRAWFYGRQQTAAPAHVVLTETRRLVYTAVTRARSRISYGDP